MIFEPKRQWTSAFGTAPDLMEPEHQRRVKAAAALWRELVRRARSDGVRVQPFAGSLEPPVGGCRCCRMAERTPEFFRSQIARIKRLLTGVTDQRTREGLTRLAEEYEARAAEIEQGQQPDEH
jgi:hypothetical protein